MGSDKAAMRAMKSNQIRMQSSSKQHKFKKQLRELNEASFGRIMQLGVLKCNKVDNILILCNPFSWFINFSIGEKYQQCET